MTDQRMRLQQDMCCEGKNPDCPDVACDCIGPVGPDQSCRLCGGDGTVNCETRRRKRTVQIMDTIDPSWAE